MSLIVEMYASAITAFIHVYTADGTVPVTYHVFGGMWSLTQSVNHDGTVGEYEYEL